MLRTRKIIRGVEINEFQQVLQNNTGSTFRLAASFTLVHKQRSKSKAQVIMERATLFTFFTGLFYVCIFWNEVLGKRDEGVHTSSFRRRPPVCPSASVQ